MKWYQFKEQAAGEKRLLALWYLYCIFGKKSVQFVSIFVALFAFSFSRQIRRFVKNNLCAIYDYTKNPAAKPTLINQFKNVLNYTFSLIDRMETFVRKYDMSKVDFNSEEEKAELMSVLLQNKGVVFICTHIGNIEVMRSFISSPKNPVNPHVNVFLSEEHCKIFKNFLKKIESKVPITIFPVETVNVDTAIELKEKIDKGELAFIAGDRISSGSAKYAVEHEFLNKKIFLPAGAFKLAQLVESSVFFICALKAKNDRYRVYLKRVEQDKKLSKKENLFKMQKEYAVFLEKMTTIAPLQFYNFYDMFEEKICK